MRAWWLMLAVLLVAPGWAKDETEWYDDGQAAMGAQDYKAAVAAFKASVTVDPRYKEGWEALAEALTKLGRVRQAARVAAVAAKSPARTRPAPKPAAKTAETKTASGARFSATYQIASFYKKDQADSMIQKLTKNGLSPSIREAEANGKRVYRIILTVTGTDQELSEAIKKTGEKGPMLLKKKPL